MRTNKKGGSPASNHVMSLFKSTKLKKIQSRRGFPKCKSKNLTGVSVVSSGGSPLSSIMNKLVKRKYSNCKQNPGKFPKPNTNNLLKLSPPVYKNKQLQGGKKSRRRSRSRRRRR